MNPAIFRNKKVLITGHTGFKGTWLSIWLEQMGAQLSGLALDPKSDKDVFVLSGIGKRMHDHRGDIRNLNTVKKVFEAAQPEIVFHLAAQPLVLESYQDPISTFATNTQGTAHILEAIRQTPSVEAAVLVTTDKCYENREWVYGYRETDPMGGHDPYSASKGAAELVIASYRRSFFSRPDGPAIASARAGNVIGGGDWSEFRLVPDIIRAYESGATLEIRSPHAVRPWQHVIEPLGGYLLLAEKLLQHGQKFAEGWNFGPLPDSVHKVGKLADGFFHYLNKHNPDGKLSNGGWRDVSDPAQAHEAGLLMLDISKAMQLLGWRPILNFDETIRFTADWYRQYADSDVLQLCQDQLNQYLELWKSHNEN